MTPPTETLPRKSRCAALLDHFAQVEDPRGLGRIRHPLPEVLLLVLCGTIADYEDIAAWGAAHLGFLRRHLPYGNGVPGERWLTILMNRINPALCAQNRSRGAGAPRDRPGRLRGPGGGGRAVPVAAYGLTVIQRWRTTLLPRGPSRVIVFVPDPSLALRSTDRLAELFAPDRVEDFLQLALPSPPLQLAVVDRV